MQTGAARRRDSARPTSWSSSATTSASPTSAPTRWADGLPHAEHRPHRQGRHDVHRLLRRAELHRRPLDLHHRPVHAPHGPEQGRHARRRRSACRRKTRRSPSCSSRWATRPGSSARTTWATATSILPTAHGFDEFFGNLYHLNAEEEPEQRTYPRDPDSEEVRPARRRSRPSADGRDRGHRAAHQEADGDDRRRDVRRRHRLHRPAGQGRQAVLLLVQQHPHASPHPCARRPPQPGPG